MNTLSIRARSIARKMGLTKILHRLRFTRSYEEQFHAALIEAIKPGDVVWDVGANVGLYSKMFCDWVGDAGFVVAFEPGAEAAQQVRVALAGYPSSQLEAIALGDSDSEGFLVVHDGESYDNQIRTEKMAADKLEYGTVPIVIRRAETVWKQLGRTPNVVKIDVEGFEGEVLAGFGDLLDAPELRDLLVEVHFQKLEARGLADSPVHIEKRLKSRGFQVHWVDPSHIWAKRHARPASAVA